MNVLLQIRGTYDHLTWQDMLQSFITLAALVIVLLLVVWLFISFLRGR